uniref:Regulation of nuclear pre-mRNA domain containing protein 1B n=1 Tax=Sphaerodactylus townsendi TaxID=933632 RepID=A0ACB8F7Z8_9SAUR
MLNSSVQTEDLIKALQDLENAASGDATVRQKIASLPQEVQDVSLLEKITDKEAAERLSKTVDEACLLLAEYNGRLAAELEDRRQLARMLIEYTQNQKDVLTEKEKKLEFSGGAVEGRVTSEEMSAWADGAGNGGPLQSWVLAVLPPACFP